MLYFLCFIAILVIGIFVGYVVGWKKATDPEAFTPYTQDKIFKHDK